MKAFLVLIFSLILGFSSSASHPKIDSLKTELQNTKADSIKVDVYNQIAFEFVTINHDSILPYTQKAIDLSTQINYPLGKALAFKHQSIYYFYKGNQEKSVLRIETAIRLLTEINNQIELAKAYQNYGILLKNQGKTNRALEKFKLSISAHKQAKNTLGVIINIINCGNIYNSQGQLDKATASFNEAKNLNLQLKDLNAEASILTGEALVAEKNGDLDLAVKNLEKSASLFEKTNDNRNVLGAYNNLGNISRKKGNYIKAIINFEKAYSIAEEQNNPRLQAIILNNLANIYLTVNDNEEALSLYKKAIGIIQNLDKSTYASLLSNLAIVQTNQKHYEEALQSLDSSLIIYRALGNDSYVANALNNIAHNYYKMGNFTEAKQYYTQAEKSTKTVGDQYTHLKTYLGLGEVFINEQKLDSAFYYAQKGYVLSKDIQVIPEESLASELLYKIYKKRGNTKKALAYLENFTKLKDSVFDQEKSKALGKLEAEIEFKNLKEQLELERKNESLENEVRVSQIQNYIIWLSIILIVSIIIIVLLLKIKNNKTRTNLLLTEKNNEIQLQNTQLNASNLQKNKLFSIISHDLRSPIHSLGQIFDMYANYKISEKEFKSWIPDINKNLNSTRLLIDNLLSWASESLKDNHVCKQELLVKPEVDALMDFFHTSFKEKKLKFVNKVDIKYRMFIDPNALKLVLRNLLSNAIKFCNAEDTITVSATTIEGYHRLCVQDTGTGMSLELSKQLFSTSQVSSTLGTQKEKGSGIGSILCTTFIHENDGHIWVDYSEIDKGTRICFSVPQKPADEV